MAMDMETIELTFASDELYLRCLAYGCRFLTVVKFDQIRMLCQLDDCADHPCTNATPAALLSPSPGTKRMEQFIATQLIRDPVAYIDLSDLVERFELINGVYPDLSIFSRMLRKSLPPEVAVTRSMIDGVRANRLIGMRLK